jgi:hypothetical protein
MNCGERENGNVLRSTRVSVVDSVLQVLVLQSPDGSEREEDKWGEREDQAIEREN